jgi:hypothetical protein
MGKKSSAPKSPDYSALIARQLDQADRNFAYQEEQFAWAKQAYAENKEVTDQTTDAFLAQMDFNQRNAEADRARYESDFQPLEDALVSDAQSFASDDRRQQEIGSAKASVSQSFDAARQNAQRELEGYGINPSSTRHAALDIGVRTAEAAAKAAAGVNASRYVDAQGRALRDQAIALGRGLPGMSLASGGQALNAGGAAGQGALNTTASGANTMGTATQYGAAGSNAVNSAGALTNTGYQNEYDAWKAEQESSSGIGSLVGGVAGAFLGGPAGGAIGSALFGGGGNAYPGGVYEDGGMVPTEASPSGGAIPDDVSAGVTAGEFILPPETVAWLGEKHMHGLIEKSTKERQEKTQQTGAIPQITPPQSAPPSALPLR